MNHDDRDLAAMLHTLHEEPSDWELTNPEQHLSAARSARRRRRAGMAATGVVAAALLGGAVLVGGDLLGGATAIVQPAGTPSLDSQFFRFRMPSESMSPTVKIGESVVFDRSLEPARGDIVFARDVDADHPEKLDVIKRVMAVGGDTVACTVAPGQDRCTFTVNGRPVPASASRSDQGSMQPLPSTKMPDGTVYLLGDAVSVSMDSRQWGPVSLNKVEGVAVQVIGTDGRARPVLDAPAHDTPVKSAPMEDLSPPQPGNVPIFGGSTPAEPERVSSPGTAGPRRRN